MKPDITPEMVEAAAKAIFFSEANTKMAVLSKADAEKEWEKHLAFYRSEAYDPQGFFPVFMLAKAALKAAAPLIWQQGYEAGQRAIDEALVASGG